MSTGTAAMTGVVLDTDVISYLFKEDTRAARLRPILDNKDLHLVISFMTIAELERWTLERRWGEPRRSQLEEFLSNRFLVHDVTSRQLCRTWAMITFDRRQFGRPIGFADAWIAATALSLDLPLLTNNRSDYRSISGLRLLDLDDETP